MPDIDPFTETQSHPGIKFENVGDVRTITVRKSDKIVDVDIATKLPKTWPNGDPKHVFVFTGESDGETKSLWVRGNMVTAIREALATANLGTVVNTKLTVKFDSIAEPSQRGFAGAHLFKAKAEPVAPPATDIYTDEEPF